MNILLVLIPVTLIVIGIAVTLFFWAVNHQQFDDLESPGALPLMDDPPPASAADPTPCRPPELKRMPAAQGTGDAQPEMSRDEQEPEP